MQSWREDESVLLHKTGLTRTELEFVWGTAKHTLIEHYSQHHTQRESPMSPFESLLVTLYWLRVYPSTRSIASEFGTDVKRIQEILDHTLHALFTTLVPACFNDSEPPPVVFRRGILAGVSAVVDSTFITLPHNSDKDERKKNYHYKSPTKQALKFQLFVTPDGMPWHLSKVVHGSKADIKLLRQSELMDSIAFTSSILGDKGYIGERRIITPTKKPRLADVKATDKKDNKKINSKRVVVENCLHQFKKWSILGSVYRGEWRGDEELQKVTRIVHVVGALVVRYLMAHPLRASSDAHD